MRNIGYELEIPNLDDIPMEDLSDYGAQFRLLADYCQSKYWARLHRLHGKIQHAVVLEDKCEKMYQALPVNLRW